MWDFKFSALWKFINGLFLIRWSSNLEFRNSSMVALAVERCTSSLPSGASWGQLRSSPFWSTCVTICFYVCWPHNQELKFPGFKISSCFYGDGFGASIWMQRWEDPAGDQTWCKPCITSLCRFLNDVMIINNMWMVQTKLFLSLHNT